MTHIQLAALLAVASLSACVSAGSVVGDQENNLSAAGFTVLPANTPERQAMLMRLPANKVSQRIEGDKVTYLYADPLVCHCLYAGGQAAFARYQQQMIARRIASDQLQAAQLQSDMAWDWGPWGYSGFGPGFGPGFY